MVLEFQTLANGEASDTAIPRLSVVIPTYNRAEMLARVLRALAVQTLPPSAFEVIVVSDGSTDETAEVCCTLAVELPFALRFIAQANAGVSAARNLGTRAARAATVLYIDDDIVADPGLLAAHLALHEAVPDGDLVALGSILLPVDLRPRHPWTAWETRKIEATDSELVSGTAETTFRRLFTGNVSMARSRVLAIGGFDERMRRAEDTEIGLRLYESGCRFVYAAEARGWHYGVHGFAGWLAKPTMYAEASLLLGREHPEEIAESIAEYCDRNVLVRLASAVSVGSPRRVALLTATLRATMAVCWWLRQERVSDACCSVIYNVRLFDALAAGVGGRRAFYRQVREQCQERQDRPVRTTKSRTSPLPCEGRGCRARAVARRRNLGTWMVKA